MYKLQPVIRYTEHATQFQAQPSPVLPHSSQFRKPGQAHHVTGTENRCHASPCTCTARPRRQPERGTPLQAAHQRIQRRGMCMRRRGIACASETATRIRRPASAWLESEVIVWAGGWSVGMTR